MKATLRSEIQSKPQKGKILKGKKGKWNRSKNLSSLYAIQTSWKGRVVPVWYQPKPILQNNCQSKTECSLDGQARHSQMSSSANVAFPTAQEILSARVQFRAMVLVRFHRRSVGSCSAVCFTSCQPMALFSPSTNHWTTRRGNPPQEEQVTSRRPSSREYVVKAGFV